MNTLNKVKNLIQKLIQLFQNIMLKKQLRELLPVFQLTILKSSKNIIYQKENNKKKLKKEFNFKLKDYCECTTFYINFVKTKFESKMRCKNFMNFKLKIGIKGKEIKVVEREWKSNN